jgi:predicted esterase
MATTTVTKKPLIIFCHGSGDTGQGARAWIEHLVPPSEFSKWDWIFPTAEPIPYQLNGGVVTSVWYDRMGGFAPTFPEQTASVERSTDRLLKIIEEETKKRDPSRIVIGGFSMGGAIAYQTATRWHAQKDAASLGGVFGLSCYLNQDSKVWSIFEGNKPTNWPPTFIAHGGSDDFILPEWGQATYERMVEMGLPAEFSIVPGVYHDMVPGEIAELLEFLKKNVQKGASASKEL